jgi:hypothetical protein
MLLMHVGSPAEEEVEENPEERSGNSKVAAQANAAGAQAIDTAKSAPDTSASDCKARRIVSVLNGHELSAVCLHNEAHLAEGADGVSFKCCEKGALTGGHSCCGTDPVEVTFSLEHTLVTNPNVRQEKLREELDCDVSFTAIDARKLTMEDGRSSPNCQGAALTVGRTPKPESLNSASPPRKGHRIDPLPFPLIVCRILRHRLRPVRYSACPSSVTASSSSSLSG